MSLNDKGRKYDGFTSLARGVDSGNSPDDIGQDQVAFAVNVTFRGGKPSTRPPMRGMPLVFDTELTQSQWNSGKVQGWHTYDGVGGAKSALIVQRGGRLFRVDLERTNYVREITVSKRNANDELVYDPNTDSEFCFMFQAEQFLIVFQGQHSPIIYDGSTARRATEKELPACYCGAYINGRIWACLANRRDYIASDIVGSPESGTAPYNYKDSILRVTENDFLNEGGAFTTPSSFGEIVAIVPTAQLDTALGQGPVAVFCANGVFTNQAPIDRTIWKYLQYPIQTQSLLDYGALGARSTINANGDIWYRSKDGIRSWIIARRNFNQGWGNTPMSFEMERVLRLDTEHLMEFGSAIVFDNRMLMTCSPHRTGFGVMHRGLAVLSFDNVARMADKDDPAWEGLWTGQRVMGVTKGRFGKSYRAFAITTTCDGLMEVWEFLPDGGNDYKTTAAGSGVPSIQISRIPCFIESRGMDCKAGGSHSFEQKRLRFAEFFVRDLAGQVDFDVKWRPDDHPAWADWHHWSECNTVSQCGEVCPNIKNFKPGYRPFMRTPEANETVDPSTGRRMHLGYEFQLRLAWTGKATITKLRLHTEATLDESMGEYRQ